MYYRNISYLMSHVFLMLFIYLFIEHRYSKVKTAGICFSASLALGISDYLQFNILEDNPLSCALLTVFQILVTQLTSLLISKKRDSKALFMSLSASNYVIAGGVTATILHIWTGSTLFAITGSSVVHAGILIF